MIGFRKNNHRKEAFVGIALTDKSIYATRMIVGGDGVTVEEMMEVSSPEKRSEQLKQVARKLGGDRPATTVLLSRDDYLLLQLERPDLPEEEIDEALRWQVREMVDFPVENAMIDHIDLPSSKREGAARMLHAVVARQEAVAEFADGLEGFDLRAIDIPEMALRDFLVDPEEGRIVAFLYLDPRGAVIEICKGCELYLVRRIRVTAGLFYDDSPNPDDMDDLLLEIQRSLDHFQNFYAAGVVEELRVISTRYEVEASFVLSACVYLSVPVMPHDFSIINGIERFDKELQRKCLLSMGAAIREMPCVA